MNYKEDELNAELSRAINNAPRCKNCGGKPEIYFRCGIIPAKFRCENDKGEFFYLIDGGTANNKEGIVQSFHNTINMWNHFNSIDKFNERKTCYLKDKEEK